MKKIISIFLVLVLMLVLSVPAFAANTTGGRMTLTYAVGSEYTVTIPADVVIKNGTGTQ